MKSIYFSILLLIIIGCAKKEKKKSINPFDVICESELFTFSELRNEEKEDMIYTNCCCYPNNWNRGVDCVEKENAYYVKAKININLLATLSESDAFNIQYLISSNPHTLYGKYVNRWKFLDENGFDICETAKFDGHNDFRLVRNDTIDEVIIGPLPKKPLKMIIDIVNSKYYKGINPEKEISNK